MLFRLVRPMKREGSRNQYYVRRIPADVRRKAIGSTLNVPLGDKAVSITIKASMQAVKFSLRTHDPVEVKARNAAADAYLEKVWQALRQDAPIKLTNEQATALAGRLYRAWARSERRERTVAVEQGADGRMRVVEHDPLDDEALFEAALMRLVRPAALGKVFDLDHLPLPDERPEPSDLERHLGPLVDHLLLAEGIRRVDVSSRGLLLVAFWRALRDALESRLRNAQGDYAPDPKAERFPAWVSPVASATRPASTAGGSLTALVQGWWVEAKARNLKPSTYESYSNTMKAFVAFLGHDDSSRVTKGDVIGFKDHRLASINPRTGRPITAKTIKDNDLSGLKAVFGWAVSNLKMPDNPAEGVTLKASKKRRKLRSQGFTDAEAISILRAALHHQRGNEQPGTYAAKRWVPWLMAYTGARVGELAQLRSQDLRHESGHWVLHITPEAGTVKTDEARDVVLHPHLVEIGFVKFVKAAPPGHLFLRPAEDGDVLGPLQGVKNRLAEFAREIVSDVNVAPNHGWRHKFKTRAIDAGIDLRIRDVIQGHKPRTEGEDYGDVTIEAQARAIAKMPRYVVS